MRTAVNNPGYYRFSAREREDAVHSAGLSRFWQPLFILGLMAVSAMLFVHFRSSTERLQAEILELRETCASGVKEIGNLQVQLERYTSPQYILAGLNRFGLDLKMPQSGQVRRLTLDDDGEAASEPVIASGVEAAYVPGGASGYLEF